MDIIHLLPDTVANQIAAGEVIQRPASVIKELVENAIDAGATLVQVLVTDAGKSCIQVVDNGKGMSATDARLAFERHSTSKISKADDLFTLHTMGFRGEALASIAAVAQVELRTRMEGDEVGTCIVIEGNKVKEERPVSTPVGANFSVRNLFFNVPARRRFLKSNMTEMASILSEFQRMALAHPSVAFKLFKDGVQILDLPEANFHRRIVALFGKRLESSLLPIEVDTPLGRISGFVGTPDSARKKGAQQYFIVNRRYMRHAYFAKAVQAAYERLVPEGTQVPFFIQFDVDPATIDVNIHPTKTEIKFEDEPTFWQILLAAVRESLGRHNAVPSIDFDTEGRPDIPLFNQSGTVPEPPRINVNPNYNPFEKSSAPRTSRGDAASSHWDKLYDDLLRNGDVSKPQPTGDVAPLLNAEPDAVPATAATYIQLQGRYIVAAVRSGLMVVDQNRAHIRVLYDAYMQQMQSHRVACQGLLFPQTLTVEPALHAVFQQIEPQLRAIGFDVAQGKHVGEIILRGVPSGTEGIDPESLLLTMLDDARQQTGDAHETMNHILSLSLARQAAIPVGQVLSADEMENLMRQLFALSTPNYTPDGRQVIAIIPDESIERHFR